MMLWRMTLWDLAPTEVWSSVWSTSLTTLTGWRRVLVMWRTTTYCLIALVRGDVPDIWCCCGLAWNDTEHCVLWTAGQIELYTHLPVMKQLVEQLQQWEFRVCGVFLVDSQFMVETFKVMFGTQQWQKIKNTCFIKWKWSLIQQAWPGFFCDLVNKWLKL